MNFERKAFNQIVCTAALASLLYGCSDEVSMVGSNETVQSIVSEDAATTPVIPPPLPSPVQTVKPSPIPSVLPPVPVVTVLPSPVPPTVIPVVTPLASPSVVTPVSQTFNLTIARTSQKPITNLYLILDNSPSTTTIHTTLAKSIVALANRIVSEKLNVNLHLLSTTDLGDQEAPSFTGTFNGAQATFKNPDPLTASLSIGGNPNSFFSKPVIDDGILANGVKINPRTTLDYVYNPANPFPVFYERTITQIASHFKGGTNGIIAFRESLPDIQAQSLITNVIEKEIMGFGTDGAQNESVMGTLYRAAAKIPSNSPERHAFAIVTNEDDQTPTNLPLAFRAKLVPTENALLQMSQTATFVTFKYCGYEYTDNVKTYHCGADALSKTMKILKCDDPNSACLPVPGPGPASNKPSCTPKIHNAINLAIEKWHKDFKAGRRKDIFPDWPQPLTPEGEPFSNSSCTANLDPAMERTKVEVDVTNIPLDQRSDLCNQKISSDENAPTYLEKYKNGNDGFARDAKCVQENTKLQLAQDGIAERRCVKSPCPVAGKFGAPEIGTMALQELKNRVGPKGFTIALIANDGIRDCDQKLEALPDAKLLDALLLESVGGNVALRNARRGHVCDKTYDPVLEGLRSFITSAPQLSYAFSGKPTDKIEVLVRDAQGNLVRTITDFKVENGQITFKEGTIEVGENIEIKVTRIAVAG